VTYNLREAEPELWSAKDSGNFFDLAAAAPSPPLVPKEEDDWEFPDDDDGGSGDDAKSSDYIAFNYR
jgi:hypothetical protein